MIKYKRVLLVIGAILLAISHLEAAPFLNLPIRIVQPDGQEISCFVSGDEYFHRIHDEKGYTIVQNTRDGYYYYARLDGNELVATTGLVGACNPETLGVVPGLVIPASQYIQLKSAQFPTEVKQSFTGTSFSNIVLFVRFTNTSEFPLSRDVYHELLNTGNASVKNYYHEASYGNLKLTSYLFPESNEYANLSVTVPYEKGYLSPYNAATNPGGYVNDGGSREQEVVAKAIEAVKSQIPSTLITDANNDGYIDNFTMIFRGDNDGWGKVFWAHQWWLNKDVTINGKKVGSFTMLPENQCNAGTVCHELFHCIGAPDLYHYTDNGITPVGPWDIMQTGYSHMSAYMKWKYSGKKWITNIPEIKAKGKYKLLPLYNSPDCCYKIASPFTSGEYFIVEFRKKAGSFEGSIPGSGLVIYRINPAASGNGNGPPDEVYSFRPGGSFWSNGNPWEAHFSADAGRSLFNAESNPRCILSDGMDGGITIDEITIHNDDSLTFRVDFKPAPEKDDWKVIYSDSEEFDTKASFAIDGDPSTIWHTGWRNTTPAYPHELQIDLGSENYFSTIKYTPRQNMSNGRLGKFSIYASNDPANWGGKLVEGEFKNSAEKQTIGFPLVKARYLRLVGESEVNGNSWASVAELEILNQVPLIAKDGWKLVECNSFQPEGYEANLAFDDKGSTFWHTKYSPTADQFPHFMTIDMGQTYSISKFSYVPRQDNNPNGTIINYSLQSSLDNSNWFTVSSGSFSKNTGEKCISFPDHVARYFKLVAQSEYNNLSIASAAEFSMFGIPTSDLVPPSAPANLHGTKVSSKQYRLNWDKSIENSGMTFYHVFVNDSLTGTTDLLTMLINAKSDSLVYPIHIKMKAIDGSGNSSQFVSYLAEKQYVGVSTLVHDEVRLKGSKSGVYLTIPEGETYHVELFDISGRKLWQGNISGTEFIPISITNRVILAHFKNGKNKFTKKFIF
ncbi:MAG: discoidin domain-containing protein [Prolixibacteraceae bacterium]|nr:discoidin domain-containing protein [Prolixibacteraceae bacterium]